MALFVQTPCKFDGDVLVDHAVWSTCDTIAALASSHIDDNEVQTYKIYIANNEVLLVFEQQSRVYVC